MDELIEMSKRMTALLIEYKEAKAIEQHDYLVDCLETGLKEAFDTPKNYILYNIKTRQVEKIDKPERIKSYLNLRRMNERFSIFYKGETIKIKPV